MALAALIHAGADIEAIRDTLRTFPIDDLDLDVEEVEVRGIAALRVHVRAGPQGVIRTYSRGIPLELVTPTGAAILAAVSEGYGDMPLMRADLVGYGAGSLRLDFPHVVRVVIGEEQRAGGGGVPPGTTLQELIAQGEVL